MDPWNLADCAVGIDRHCQGGQSRYNPEALMNRIIVIIVLILSMPAVVVPRLGELAVRRLGDAVADARQSSVSEQEGCTDPADGAPENEPLPHDSSQIGDMTPPPDHGSRLARALQTWLVSQVAARAMDRLRCGQRVWDPVLAGMASRVATARVAVVCMAVVAPPIQRHAPPRR